LGANEQPSEPTFAIIFSMSPGDGLFSLKAPIIAVMKSEIEVNKNIVAELTILL